MESLEEAWGWTEEDHTLHVLPLHHIHGVMNILNTALFAGACCEFAAFDAAGILARLGSGDVSCFHAVPTVYVKLMQHLETLSADARDAACAALRTPSVRLMVCGSAALPVPTMQAWARVSGHVLLERYGMTEIGMGLSNKATARRFPGCVGWPLPKVRVSRDSEDQLLVAGPTVFAEYYKRPEATAESFTADGWFKTGDTVQVGGTAQEIADTVAAAGLVEVAAGRSLSPPPDSLEDIYRIMGRTSVDIIKSGGYKISALEIEAVLLGHEAINEVAVVGLPDATWGEMVTAIVVLQAKAKLDLKSLRAWGKERIATYKVPQRLEIWEALPRNQLGKLEKKKITAKFV
jgi:malonyl-CoA/methylmalonyl-CoA synthetase